MSATQDTGSWFINGGPTTAVTCTKLVAASVWFQCEPHPNDWYRFTLKRDAVQGHRPPIARDQPW